MQNLTIKSLDQSRLSRLSRCLTYTAALGTITAMEMYFDKDESEWMDYTGSKVGNRIIEKCGTYLLAVSLSEIILPLIIPSGNEQTVETDNQTVETDNQTGETDNQTVETDNQTVETDNQSGEIDNQTVETDNQTGETENQTGETENTPDPAMNVKVATLDKDLQTIRQPSVDELRRPWILSNLSMLPENMDHCKKIWIMGRYKVGKSTILQMLGVESASPANLVNTKGEVYLTDSSWPNTIFVDTEGFMQPIDTSEPEFRKHLVVKHAHKASDGIILVLPMLITNDLTLFTKSVKMLHGRHRSLFVVHNLPNFENESEILHYRETFQKIFIDMPDTECSTRDDSRNILKSWHGHRDNSVCVVHFFLGNSKALKGWNEIQLELLKLSITGLNTHNHPLLETLSESLASVGDFAYSFGTPTTVTPEGSESQNGSEEVTADQTRTSNRSPTCPPPPLTCMSTVDEDNDCLVFQFSRPIVGSKAREIGDNIIMGNTLDFVWLPMMPVIGGKGYMQSLIIGMSRISRIFLTIEDERTLLCEFTVLNINSSGKYDESQCVERIFSEYPIPVTQDTIFVPVGVDHEVDDEVNAAGEVYKVPRLSSTTGATINNNCTNNTPTKEVLPGEYLPRSREMRYNIRLNII